MRIQAWNPDFKPEEETPLVPIWIALRELPWHCYNKVLLTAILSYIGKVLYLDSPSSQKTRGSMARVKVQVDLTKERPPHVWVGFKNSDPNKGRWQKIQYEGIPDYCLYCKHQGKMDNRNDKPDETSGQTQGKKNFIGQQQGVDNQIHPPQEQETADQEELWQVQKRKQNRNQEQPTPRRAWRPVSPQHRGTKDNRQHDETPSETQEYNDNNNVEEGIINK
ncbi:hypothetical protein KY289_022202 [Solanum tuberosum]|nr:hypothetical protein KY289_022202 [Solanum tuberosum]